MSPIMSARVVCKWHSEKGTPVDRCFPYRFKNGMQGSANCVCDTSLPFLQPVQHRRHSNLPVSAIISHKPFCQAFETLSSDHDTVDVCIALHPQRQRLGKLSELWGLLNPGRSIEKGQKIIKNLLSFFPLR